MLLTEELAKAVIAGWLTLIIKYSHSIFHAYSGGGNEWNLMIEAAAIELFTHRHVICAVQYQAMLSNEIIYFYGGRVINASI